MLNAKNISKTYKKDNNRILILNNINLQISKGQIIALMGPSGSGKTTLLNILGTLDNDFSGTLKIDNIDINNNTNLPLIRANKIGFVFQFHHLLPEFTIYENLMIPLMISKNNKERRNFITEMLKLTGLDARKNHLPNEISGGERQRVAVIRALVNNPSIILADEPTGNLDAENSKIILKLIVDLREKYKQTFIIASHDDSILKIADKILYLNDGKLKKENN